MKKALIAMVAMVAFAGSAFAAAQENYEYKGGSFGKVAFPHKVEINKDVAHNQLCVKCHKAEAKGPQGCKDCHKK